MGRGELGIVPSLTTQRLYFRQENAIRQPRSGTSLDGSAESMTRS